ncbi:MULTISPECIES: FtsW/RodA/SpoVE family cell cycle protein [Weeksella]|uniref:FtsW/RodA/SpoVE family cell cycle protein n=1 Tax=Weeksella TaxID=1013 RepID=UPI0008A18ABB|nr:MULTISPECIES: FtsW/RodA/SpoVE family cell cycle protein [Weeksella]MDK7374372.1 FtsW/RodA/SpoVE family cell cycle protein [Weeksella virosa]MDK7675681.1 FtsW/RodA/SpoVE family cell cycle protein [Weeksella virosa]OFM81960.1 cell division protein FtsW [Weeksella sp. HMSC059D05]SUP53691.1 Cell division protein FtsW [Weeksella virosa]
MRNIIQNNLKGDKALWAFIILLALFSFLPVYSASSNLVYTVGSGTVLSHMIKHAGFLLGGLLIIFFVQRFDYKWFGVIAIFGVFITSIILLFTALMGTTIEGANAARWLSIPGIGVGIQPSVLASQALLIYIARYLTINRNKQPNLQNIFLYLFLPIVVVVGLILPANGSTALMLLFMCGVLLFIGGFPTKYLLGVGLVCGILIGLFIYIALYFPDLIPNTRVHTWMSRINKFFNDEGVEGYQVLRAKAAIAKGLVEMAGPGKSVFKQTLPQSSSDFIFAIIVEEYGLFGALFLIGVFTFILYRICVIATKIHTIFGTLLVFAVGMPIIIQAFVNMAVAVSLFPVTGQPLPLISYGGTSLWMTCISFGVILSVSTKIKSKEEIELEKELNSEEVIEDIA